MKHLASAVATNLSDGVVSGGSPLGNILVIVLEMRGISKSFFGVPVLSAIDLDCQAGEVHAIVGENGAGKSTLMKILAGAYQPDSGEIKIDNKEVHFGHPGAILDAIDAAQYAGPLCIESFSAGNMSLASAASIWRPLKRSQDAIATDGLTFLTELMAQQEFQRSAPR